MRELKFRAWDTQAKCMLGGGGMQLNATSGKLDHLPSIIPMQFTGLLDKNGKEVWEGDILRVTVYRKSELVEVAWGLGEWWIRDPETKCWYPTNRHTQYIQEGEVIGNVHQNQKLVEEVK